VRASFVPPVYETTKLVDRGPDQPAEERTFPPSIKITVKPSGEGRSKIVKLLCSEKLVIDGVEKLVDKYAEVGYRSVTKGHAMTPVIHYHWVYRKSVSVQRGPGRTMPGFSFSLRCELYQAIVEASGSYLGGDQPKDTITVIPL
jgi:hypothetical protein